LDAKAVKRSDTPEARRRLCADYIRPLAMCRRYAQCDAANYSGRADHYRRVGTIAYSWAVRVC